MREDLWLASARESKVFKLAHDNNLGVRVCKRLDRGVQLVYQFGNVPLENYLETASVAIMETLGNGYHFGSDSASGS